MSSVGVRVMLLAALLAQRVHAQSRNTPVCPELPPVRTTLLQCQVTTDVTWHYPLVTPVFPSRMLAARVEGIVRLGMTVALDGTVDTASIKVFQSSHDLFTLAARAAVVRWRGTPARLGNTVVREYREQDFLFSLPPTAGCTWSGPEQLSAGIPACAPPKGPQLRRPQPHNETLHQTGATTHRGVPRDRSRDPSRVSPY